MKRTFRSRGRLGSALIASALLHCGAIVFFWAVAARGPEVPAHKVYSVNLVSPPPRAQGETAPERVVAEAEPTPEPAAEPTPPAPEPTPPTPQPRPQPTPPAQREAAPPAQREPSPPARPTTRPTPAEPQRAQPTPPAQQARPAPAEQRPAATPPRQTPAETRPATPAQRTPPATASTPPRQGETAPRPAPSTGAAPSPTSQGGENLAIRTEGATCPSEGYCNNIAAMVKRYFRRPPDSYSDRGDVCFRIARDGSVSDIDVQRLRGNFAFRLALMEAVEQAGRRNEFGPLPRQFGSDWLPVCVGVTPQM